MNTLIIGCVILWILAAISQGLSIETLGALISTSLFCSRKIGHFCKLNTLVAIECISMFLTIAWGMLFKSIQWSRILFCIVIRLIFLAVCYYDTKEWVYVKEVHRKEK